MFGVEAAMATAIYQQVKTNKQMKFDKSKVTVLVSVEGTKGSKWDALAEILTEPGAHYPFDPDEVSKATAAQAAARLRKITGKQYHSGYHALEKYTYVRLRPDGEVTSKDDEESEEDEDGKGCPPDTVENKAVDKPALSSLFSDDADLDDDTIPDFS